jgi:hypothetical protein
MLNAVKDALGVSNRLCELFVYSSEFRLLSSACITPLRPTLRSLTVYNRNYDNYSLADMGAVRNEYPDLEQLALDLPARPKVLNNTCDQSWTLKPDVQKLLIKSGLQAILEVIAQFPKLHTLRILQSVYAPVYRRSHSRTYRDHRRARASHAPALRLEALQCIFRSNPASR